MNFEIGFSNESDKKGRNGGETENGQKKKKTKRTYYFEVISLVIGCITLFASFPENESRCNGYKDSCSGYTSVTCASEYIYSSPMNSTFSVCQVPGYSESGNPIDHWDFTNCTFWDGDNDPVSSLNLENWLTDKGRKECEAYNGTAYGCDNTIVYESCADYCSTLSCARIWLVFAAVFFSLCFDFPLGEDEECITTLDTVLNTCAKGLNSLTAKIVRLAIQSYMLEPTPLFWQIWLAAELIVSVVFLVGFTACCWSSAKSSAKNPEEAKQIRKNSAIRGRSAASVWVLIISLAVISIAGSGGVIVDTLTGRSALYKFRDGAASAISTICVFLQSFFEIADFFLGLFAQTL